MTVIISHFNHIYADNASIQFGSMHSAKGVESFTQKSREEKVLYNKNNSLVCVRSGRVLDSKNTAMFIYLMEMCYSECMLSVDMALIGRRLPASQQPERRLMPTFAGVRLTDCVVEIPLKNYAVHSRLNALHEDMTQVSEQIVIAGARGTVYVDLYMRTQKKGKDEGLIDQWHFKLRNLTDEPMRAYGSGGVLASCLMMAGYTPQQAVVLCGKYHTYGHEYGVTVVDTLALAPFIPRSVRMPRTPKPKPTP